MKIAIIGSGISGLSVAHQLRGQADITLYEAGDYFGGHTHTVDVTLPDASGAPVTHGVDTGFLVFNERTYPHLIRLLADLGVETAQSDMSFSVQVPGALGGSGGGRTLEWSGTNLSTVFAQRTNLVNPRFLGMLRDLLRFNKLCTRIAEKQAEAALMQPLGDFLREHRDQSFCVWASFPDPHHPFDAPEPWCRLHHPDDVDLPEHRTLDLDRRPWWHRAALEGVAYQNVDVLSAMQDDAGIALSELRVDGGAARNDMLMQFQADILNVPVVRPVVTETTALGAAYLAGLAVGFWASQEEIAAQWQVGRRFEPAMAADERLSRLHKWQRAVERSRDWSE